MKKNSVLRKVLAVSLAAAMLAGTGFTTVGQFVGTNITANAVGRMGPWGYYLELDYNNGEGLWYFESAFAKTYGDFKYLEEYDNANEVTIIRYLGNSSDVTVPSAIDGKRVTSIQRYCHEEVDQKYDSTFSTVGAFSNPDGSTNSSLLNVTIPSSVVKICSGAFSRCDNLVIHGQEGSYAETYANENNIPFVSEYSNISTISSDEIVLGETVTVNAKAVLGDGDYTYAVLYKKKADTKWTVKQNYSTNDTITIKPAKATDYDVCVKVKDSTGKIVKKFFEVKVNAKLKNTSTISATTIKKGNTVTLNGSATGGMGGYTYAVLYKKKAETKWTTRQGYKDNSEILVRPYTNTDYDICIKVKDKDGTIAKKYFTVTVTK